MPWLEKYKIYRDYENPYDHSCVENLVSEKPAVELLVFSDHLEEDSSLSASQVRGEDVCEVVGQRIHVSIHKHSVYQERIHHRFLRADWEESER